MAANETPKNVGTARDANGKPVGEAGTPDVLTGVTTTPRKPRTRKPATPKAPTQAEMIAALLAKVEALETRSASPARSESGHRAWATKEIPSAMAQFARWIEREYPELGAVDPKRDARLVMIASKAYRAFQGSDMRVRD